MIQDEKIFSLIIKNCAAPYKIKIIPGKQSEAYYIGEYGQCLELARDFDNQYQKHNDRDIEQA